MKSGIYGILKAEFCDFDAFLSSKPPLHYKVYKIPKRTIGFRTIAQPTPILKKIQKTLVGLIEPHVKIHSNAAAYRLGKGVKENALSHINSNYLLKIDLEEFFNSITPNMLFKTLRQQHMDLSDIDKYVVEQVFFWNRSRRKNGRLILSVGAPSSPFISNLIMSKFDNDISMICDRKGVSYTRYADDMTFSTKERDVIFSILADVRRVLKNNFGNKMNVNELKTVFSSKAHNRRVTGVTLTNDNKISIGRERKRYISALTHKFKLGKLDISDIYHLKGLISYARHVDGGFIRKLQKKYGVTTLELIKKYPSEG
ncbi:retron St85 family RNA-directed DNA polymerase [Rheinheimera aquimaris]|jgi:retron-type reverse transcriptase|nr:retron St85 family RNA-directed DNA polymerase [Rheinheimera aquimaris]MCD1598535.1 retron St85 family RNA-directed DNA polymerase [Rheinheimera aquimaris]|tara:strand:- start:2900 stop:3838 length:939 start_codon:yes stop_codon:yes gene_type:complete